MTHLCAGPGCAFCGWFGLSPMATKCLWEYEAKGVDFSEEVAENKRVDRTRKKPDRLSPLPILEQGPATAGFRVYTETLTGKFSR